MMDKNNQFDMDKKRIKSSIDFVIRLPILITNYTDVAVNYRKDLNVIVEAMSFSSTANELYSQWIREYNELRSSLPKDEQIPSIASERISIGMILGGPISELAEQLATQASVIENKVRKRLYNLQMAIDMAHDEK